MNTALENIRKALSVVVARDMADQGIISHAFYTDLPALGRLVDAAKKHDDALTEMEQRYKRPDLYFSLGSYGNDIRVAVHAIEGDKHG